MHFCQPLALCAALVGSAVAQTPIAQPPHGLTDSEWSGIRSAIAADRLRVREVCDTLVARNPSNAWDAEFDGRGFTVRPDHGHWTWGLELASYGFEGELRSIDGDAASSIDETRVEYSHDDTLTEWFVNRSSGIEHGFTVHAKPDDATSDSLVFDLAVRGGLKPVALADGSGIRFLSKDGVQALGYTGLKVFDADGDTLAATLSNTGRNVHLTVDTDGATYPITIDPLVQTTYLKSPSPDSQDRFSTVQIDGDTLVVGAVSEDSAGTGVNSGLESNNGASGSGAAYVFARQLGAWSLQAYLKASNTEADDNFAFSLDVSGDTIAIGAANEDSAGVGINPPSQSDNSAPSAGAVYVFRRSGSTWSQEAYIKASNTGPVDFFGLSVALDGDTLVVGARGEDSIGIGVNGPLQADDSAPNAGAAYVFTRTGATWSQQAYLKASNTDSADSFGTSVAVSGSLIAVSAAGEASSGAGVNGALQGDNSQQNAGAVYVFGRTGTTWSQEAYIKASNPDGGDLFGNSIALSGETLLVGAQRESSSGTGINPASQSDNSATNAGAAYVFVRSGNSWSQEAYLKASNTGPQDAFGFRVALSGDAALIGAPVEDGPASGLSATPQQQLSDGSPDTGAVYLFTRSASVWSQSNYIKSSNPDIGDRFGFSVALSSGRLAVGADFESSNGSGVNSNAQGDNSLPQAGAVYVFEDVGPPMVTSVSTRTLPTVPTDRVEVLGSNFEDVTSIDLSGTSITSQLPTSTCDGYFEIESSGRIFIYPPQGIRQGNYDFVLQSPFGNSPRERLTLLDPTAPALSTATDFPVGAEQSWAIHTGPGTGPFQAALFFSFDPTPSSLPLFVELEIGNMFTTLSDPIPVTINPLSGAGCVRFGPIPASAAGGTIYYEAVVADPAFTFPLATTNSIRVDYRL